MVSRVDAQTDETERSTFAGGRQGDISGAAKTSGTARYVGDLQFNDLLEVGVVRSTVPHASIVSIDLTAALKVPGVVAAVTSDDFGDVTYLGFGGKLSDRPPLARGTTRYVGEEIAALAASSRDALSLALPLVKVGYRRKQALLDANAALAPQAPRLHQINDEGNIVRRSMLKRGELDSEARSGRSLIAHYKSGSQTHTCLETHTVVAYWPEESGVIDIWAPTQGPTAVRREIAHVFGVDEQRIAMHDVAIGGDFGSHVKISTSEAIAVALARKTRRPVRLQLTREEEFAVTKHRYPFDVDIELRADENGLLTHMKADAVCDMGAYHYVGAGDFGFFPQSLSSLYAIDNLELSTVGVYTNQNPPGSFRGAGAPQATFVRECALDELAGTIGLDPIDIRLRNLVRKQDPTTGWDLDNQRLKACLERARDEIGWRAAYEVNGLRRGFGIAIAAHVTGVGELKAGAFVEIENSGRIVVRSASADPGTGHRTILAQVAAHELDIPIGEVQVVLGEPQSSPYDPGLGASKGSYISSNAVGAAARNLAEKLKAAAIQKFAVNEVTLADGFAHTAKGSAKFRDLIAYSSEATDGVLRGIGSFEAGRSLEDPNASDGYSYAAHAVEVEVDEELGLVNVIRVVAVHDSGTILNSITARGQIEGGVVMGLGAALGEELVNEGGRAVNTSFADYVVPRASNQPRLDVILLGSSVGPGRYGSRGVAEACLAPTSAAVANAIADATGVRIRSLPVTPDKIVRAGDARSGRAMARSLWGRPSRWWVACVRHLYSLGLHRLLDRWSVRRVNRRSETPGAISVHRAVATDDAIASLSAGWSAQPFGGGSDLLLRRRQGLLNGPATLVDLRHIEELKAISIDVRELRIGAAATLSEIMASAAIPERAGLRETISEIASDQIRNIATLAGNLCQAKRCWFYRHGFNCYKRSGPTSPCYAIEGDHRFYHAAMKGHRCQATTPSDVATTLMALDASVEIRAANQSRSIKMADLYVGPGEVSLRHGELITEVVVPRRSLERTTAFQKLSLYKGGFAVCSCAASLRLDAAGRVTDISTVLGGIAPTPHKLIALEKMLLGQEPTRMLIKSASQSWIRDAHPLRDNGWKILAAAALTARVLNAAVARAAP